MILLGLIASELGGPVPSPRSRCRASPTSTSGAACSSGSRAPKSNLPQDPQRDNFYGGRYGNHAKVDDSNTYYDGGLYGVRLPARDTASVYPFFLRGARAELHHPRKQVVAAVLPAGRPTACQPAQAGRDVLRPRQLCPDL